MVQDRKGGGEGGQRRGQEEEERKELGCETSFHMNLQEEEAISYFA